MARHVIETKLQSIYSNQDSMKIWFGWNQNNFHIRRLVQIYPHAMDLYGMNFEVIIIWKWIKNRFFNSRPKTKIRSLIDLSLIKVFKISFIRPKIFYLYQKWLNELLHGTIQLLKMVFLHVGIKLKILLKTGLKSLYP